MDIKQLESWLTEGLDDTQAAVVRAAINRDNVKTKTASLREQSEFATIEAQRQALQAELDGDPAKGVPGSKAYKEWYAKNYAAVEANSKAIEAYDKKHGAGAFAQMTATLEANPNNPQPGTGTGLTKEDVAKLVQEQFQNNFGPNIANVIKSAGSLVQKHMYAKRTAPIDFAQIETIMSEAAKAGRNLSIEDAYDQWDKPERDKATAAATESEITRRVNEELQKRGASAQFPGGADMTPSALSQRSNKDREGFDRNALLNDLRQTWNNPEGQVQ